MKLILLRDVKKIGRAHEEVEVADGFALNYLIPNKFAVLATAVARKAAEGKVASTGARKELDAHLFAQNLATLAEATVTLKRKANEKGHLYDGVGKGEIAAAVKESAKVDLPEDSITLEKPIKELGTFKIPASYGEVFGEFTLVIIAE